MKKNIFKLIMVSCIYLLFSVSPAYAFLGIFGDSAIMSVKNGTFEFDNSVTIGDALDGHEFLKNQKWESFEDSQKRKYVSFSASVDIFSYITTRLNDTRGFEIHSKDTIENYRDERPNLEVNVDIEFKVNKDGTFEITFLEYSHQMGSIFKPATVFDAIDDMENIFQNSFSEMFVLIYATQTYHGIHDAVLSNNLKKLVFFLDNGSKKHIDSALRKAFQSRKYECFEILLANGADINSKDEFGRTLLQMAQETKDISYLIKNGINLSGAGGSNVGMLANTKDIHFMNLLLEKGFDVNVPDDNGRTELIRAIWADNYEAVSVILKKSSTINLADKSGQNALMYAVQFQNVDILKLLLKEGANTELVENRNLSALWFAVNKNDSRLVRLLLEHGASPNTADSALKEYSDKEIKMLIKEYKNKGRSMNEPSVQEISSHGDAEIENKASEIPQSLYGEYFFWHTDKNASNSLSLYKGDDNTLSSSINVSAYFDGNFCDYNGTCIFNDGKLYCNNESSVKIQLDISDGKINISKKFDNICNHNLNLSGSYEKCIDKVIESKVVNVYIKDVETIDNESFVVFVDENGNKIDCNISYGESDGYIAMIGKRFVLDYYLGQYYDEHYSSCMQRYFIKNINKI